MNFIDYNLTYGPITPFDKIDNSMTCLVKMHLMDLDICVT